jgi:transposase
MSGEPRTDARARRHRHHGHPAVREALGRAGAQVFPVPLYSPHINPIEHVSGKLKTSLRQHPARNIEALLNTIGRQLDTSLLSN